MRAVNALDFIFKNVGQAVSTVENFHASAVWLSSGAITLFTICFVNCITADFSIIMKLIFLPFADLFVTADFLASSRAVKEVDSRVET